jgi:hypothetical protein
LQKASRLSGILTPASFTLDVRGASARNRQSAAADSERKPFCRLAIPKKARTPPSAIVGTRYHRDRRRAQKLAPVPTSTYEHAVSSRFCSTPISFSFGFGPGSGEPRWRSDQLGAPSGRPFVATARFRGTPLSFAYWRPRPSLPQSPAPPRRRLARVLNEMSRCASSSQSE